MHDDDATTEAELPGSPLSGPSASAQSGQFPATSYSKLLEARGDDENAAQALADLCRRYWYPLYAFLRRRNHSKEDAQDLTQGFFASFLAARSFEKFEPSRGKKLRSYLIGALKHFESNWRRQAQTIKAGGKLQFVSFEWLQAEERYQSEPRDIDSPDRLFDRSWALTLLQCVHEELKSEYQSRGKAELFDQLHPLLEGAHLNHTQEEAANELGMTRNAVKTALSRMRARRRDLTRAQIALTVSSAELVDEEIGFLLTVFETDEK